MEEAVPGVSLRAWKPSVPGVREVLHARFSEHGYPPHTHDTWTLFIVDSGAIWYDLHKRTGAAGPGMVTLLPPYVTHDGRPATSAGFRKRVLYLEPTVLGEEYVGAAVDRPVISVPSLRSEVAGIHRALGRADGALEAEMRLGVVAERIRGFLRSRAGSERAVFPRSSASPRNVAEQLRAFLDLHLNETITMAGAAAELGASPTQLARAFANEFEIAPHAYVMGRRMDLARDRFLRGQPISDVAAELGFADQAHLTRRFKQFLGTTPGRFARS